MRQARRALLGIVGGRLELCTKSNAPNFERQGEEAAGKRSICGACPFALERMDFDQFPISTSIVLSYDLLIEISKRAGYDPAAYRTMELRVSMGTVSLSIYDPGRLRRPKFRTRNTGTILPA